MCHAAEDLKIKGSIDMLSKVFYTRGRCDIGPVQRFHNSQLDVRASADVCADLICIVASL